jgi:hypothetical protein
MPTLERIFIYPDTHCPYQDKRALALAHKARLHFKPDHTVILGDFADFYAVSSHSKAAGRLASLEAEVEAVNHQLDIIDRHKDQRHFISGNHEFRLERYLNEKAPELFGLISIPGLLMLKDRGWSYTPYGEAMRIGHMNFTHDEGSSGPTAHMRARETFGGNVVIGHCHSAGIHYSGTTRGKTHVGASFGWLGDVKEINYLSRVKASKWTHGFGIGHKEANGTVHLQMIPIIDGRCVVNGQLISL